MHTCEKQILLPNSRCSMILWAEMVQYAHKCSILANSFATLYMYIFAITYTTKNPLQGNVR